MESDSAVSVIETGSSGQRTQQMLDHLADKVNGVILSTDAPGISFIRDYAKRVPLVVLNRPLEGVASVVPDPRIGTVRTEPAETLPSHRGHVRRRPGRVMGQSVEVAAVHDIGNRMGFKVNQIGPVHPTVEGGYQAALALEGGDTTAIITYNDLIAVGIVLRFTADGVNVPGDVSVIGFDNTLIAPVVMPPITSIRIPRAQLGQVAVHRLLLMMISPMILLGVFLWIPGMPFGIYVFACWRCTWEMTPETAGFGAHARGEKRDGHVGMAGWLRRARLVLREYASTLRVKEFRKHLAIYLLVQVTMDVFGQTFVFFVVYDWNHTAAFASLMPGCAAVSLPLMPVFGWAMTKIGPKRLYAINFIGWLGTAWLFAAWMLVGTLPEPWWTVFPYIADIDQIVTRRYRSATFSGIQASFRQLGSGIATIAAGLVLGSVGFDATRAWQTTVAGIGLGAVLLAGLPSCRRDGHLLDCVRPSRHQQACGRHRIDRDHPPAQRRRQGRRHARNPSCGGTTDRSALRELLAVAGEARPMNGRAAMPCRSLHW
ncbi:substrate-binding domain-containing protein [Bifidobacterium bifidum]|uniref:substrate-binding domain-containing protein n=1 Tax=Bifidobacterium bifidum TaxID=1681 RepID=UPI00254E00B5|nr:substrate-binding domain-containing protein [Bifidobacterium bifidum]MDK7286206.1 substrate-binding domain-containing protein [Bifidobacterium bifidum]